MTLSQDILKALAVFHLDRPEATWSDLKERLAEVAHGLLMQAYSNSDLSIYDEIYSDPAQSLMEAAATASLSLDQHRALDVSREIVKGAQARLGGNPRSLMDTIERLEEPESVKPVCLSVYAPSSRSDPDQSPLTFAALAALFLKERQGNVKSNTLHAIESNCRTLIKLLGDLDIRNNTRADMVALKEKVTEGRKPLTVNKLLTQLSTVMDWTVNNGFIERSFDKGLKIERGAESERRPFSRDEVAAIMEHANALPADDWKRWGLSHGVLTGARIGELYQLTQADVKEVDGGITIIDINQDGQGKTLKNDFS